MIWIILTLLFFLFPIPIIINLKYIENNLSVYILGIKLYPHEKSNKKSKKKSKRKKSEKISLKTYKELWHKITNSSVKPSLYFKFDMIYGLDDAAKTAISYGMLSSLSSFLYNLLYSLFHIRKFKITPQPNFEKSMLELKIQSIIIINLVKIIYIGLLVFLTIKGSSKKSLNSKEAM